MKKHNFNAGPSILADEVIQNAAKAIVDFNGSGLSLLSISHRTKDFENVMAEADALFRTGIWKYCQSGQICACRAF